MSKAVNNTGTIELQYLQQNIASRVSDLALTDVNLKEYRDVMARDMVYQLRAYVLADHIEVKRADYTVVKLPRWLRWLDRWLVKENKVVELHAYHTYPEATVKLPSLGNSRTVTFKNEYTL